MVGVLCFMLILCPIKTAQAEVSGVVVGKALSTTTEKVVAGAVLSRVGLRGSSTALAKAAEVWGCRAAVVAGSTLSGAEVAAAASIGTGAAVVAGGATAPAWVPVVLGGVAVASLVVQTVSLVNDIKAMTTNKDEDVMVNYVVDTQMYYRNGYGYYHTKEVPFEMPIASPEGDTVAWGEFGPVPSNPSQYTRPPIVNGVPNYSYCYYEDAGDYSHWRFRTMDGYWYVEAYDVDRQEWRLAGYPGVNGNRPVSWTPGTSVTPKVVSSYLILDRNSYSSSNVNVAPDTSSNPQQIKINIPNLDMIRQNNPSYTEQQVLDEAMNMIANNPEYVVADNEFMVQPDPEPEPEPEPEPLPSDEIGLLQSIRRKLDDFFKADDTTINLEPLKMLGTEFTQKFPFSLPWDLLRGIESLQGTNENWEPVFTLDFSEHLEHGVIVIDLRPYQSWADMSKVFLALIFDFGLVMVTRRLLGGAA